MADANPSRPGKPKNARAAKPKLKEEAELLVEEGKELEADLIEEASKDAPVEKVIGGRKVLEDRTPSGNVRHRYL